MANEGTTSSNQINLNSAAALYQKEHLESQVLQSDNQQRLTTESNYDTPNPMLSSTKSKRVTIYKKEKSSSAYNEMPTSLN